MKNILGHQAILAYFSDRSEQKNFSHAYLLAGPQKVGKRALISHLISAYFCEGTSSQSLFGATDNQSESEKPCYQCQSCRMLAQDIHPDLTNLSIDEDAHSLSVDQIRDILKKAYRSPTISDYKFIVIDNAHTMTKAASNALLKTLEEPPASCIIFLISHTPHLMPATISSRCQVFELSSHSSLESLGAENQEIQDLSRGLPGVYTELLDPDNVLTLKEGIDYFIHLLLISKGERLRAIEPLFKKTKDHVNAKKVWKDRLQLWQDISHDIILHQLGLPDLIQYHQVEMAPNTAPKTMLNTIDAIDQIRARIDQNINLRLQVERLLLQI